MTHVFSDTDRAQFREHHCSYVNSAANLCETNCCCICPESDMLPCIWRCFKLGVFASFTASFLKPHTPNVQDSVTADTVSFLKPHTPNVQDSVTAADTVSWPQKFDSDRAQSDTQAYAADEFCSPLYSLA